MSLTILTTNEERLAGITLSRIVRERARRGDVVVLAPSFAEMFQIQKGLADAGLSLGVHVGIPSSWLRDLWDVWGDGRRIVGPQTRTLLMTQMLEQETSWHSNALEGQSLGPTAGIVRLMCDLAQRGLARAKKAPNTKGNKDKLTPAEQRMVGLLGCYEQILAQKDLVEGVACASELCEELRRVGYRMPSVVLVGFDELVGANRAFVNEVIRIANVTVVVRACNELAHREERDTAGLLEASARGHGVLVVHKAAAVQADDVRAGELQELLDGLYNASGSPIDVTGAIRLLEPSGPAAEAELVAREVVGLARRNAASVVVVVPDVRRAWRELVPKLVARGVTARAQLSVSVLDTEPGRAFMGYARTVAQLMELAKRWPAPLEGPDGSYVRLGNMEWWPPRELVDFLLCDMSQVGQQKAYTLDALWRGNRLLSPDDVLSQLTSVKSTSGVVERATRELMQGRLGSAASKLLAPYIQRGAIDPSAGAKATVSFAEQETVAVLQAVLGVANTLKELGIFGDAKVEGSVKLIDLVGKAELMLRSSRIVLRPSIDVRGGRGNVLVTSRQQAASIAPASVDVAVLCGLTSEEYGVPSSDNELSGMLEALEIETPRDALSMQRSQFWRLCALPKAKLLLERPRFNADSYETYPAVMLSEVLACYRENLPCSTLAEDAARANLSASGEAPERQAVESVAAAGCIDDSLRRLVTVPQEGQEELTGGLPVLSASQLESYLECPLKWFSLRRLRLSNNDAGFGPLEMGTFAHRVLELTYAQLYDEGKSQLDPRNTKDIAHAHEVLNSCFSLHLQHQHMRSGAKGVYQALVAHSSWEESNVERLRRDLLSSIDYGAERLRGYEPRAFEWEFGRGERETTQGGMPCLPSATYAGVQVTGTVDRIDVNGQGQAVIIDYKHKGPVGFFGEYAAFSKRPQKEEDFVLPRRIQALLYAQVVRRAFPDLKVVGAMYLGTRGTHELSGAVAQSQAEAVYGGTLGPRRAYKVTVDDKENFGQPNARGMDALLDATEQAIAKRIERLREGHIEANPVDAAACSYCPVLNCERRLQ